MLIKITFYDSNQSFILVKTLSEITWQEFVEFVIQKNPQEFDYYYTEDNSLIANEQNFLDLKHRILTIQGKQQAKFIIKQKNNHPQNQQIPKANESLQSHQDQQKQQHSQTTFYIQCTYCKQEPLISHYFRCNICKVARVIVCQNCEQKDLHSEHPLLKVKNTLQEGIIKDSVITKLFTLFQKNENQLQQKGTEKGLFSKLFQNKEDEQYHQMKMAFLGQIFQVDSVNFEALVTKYPEFTEDQLLDIIMKNPKLYKINIE